MTDRFGRYDEYDDETDPRALRLRYAIYAVLIITALSNVVGRILAVNSVDYSRLESYRISQRLKDDRKKYINEGLAGEELEARVAKRKEELEEKLRLQRPFLSSNDRSRWAATRALVEFGRFDIDKVIEQPGWDTIDMVQHKGIDGRWHLYSSKPPLMSVMMALPYYIITKVTGMTLATDPYVVGRIMLILINVPALLLFMVFAVKMAERWAESDWAKIFVVAAACWATFLNTFAVVINNHLIAAASAMVAVYCTLRIWRDEEPESAGYAIVAGFFATMTVAFELPALSLWCVLGVAIFSRKPKDFLYGYIPWTAVVAVMFFGTNHVVHRSLKPPYMHRGIGAELFELPVELRPELSDPRVSDGVFDAFKDAGYELSNWINLKPYTTQVKGDEAGDESIWLLTDTEKQNRYTIIDDGDELTVHAWDNWYDYEYTVRGRVRESYWRNRENRSKIDQGEESRLKYALNVLVGHHGIFSLTPIWILSMVGIVLLLRDVDADVRWTAIAVAVLTFVCIAFFIARPIGDRNYGGMTSGFRWMFWFAPLWLWTMIPAADAARRRKLWRRVSYVLLGLSVMSASYPTWNPWTMPWIYRYFEYLGWISS
ncbi:MAG: hypothetical protein MI757_15090 [Pirellulales bacterium]|nr:hypothetical protein [Pirellulales bacterium]